MHITETAAQLSLGGQVGFSIPFNRQEILKLDDANDFFIYRISFEEQDVAPSFSLVAHYRYELIYFQTELAYRRTKTRFIGDNFIDLDDITRIEYSKLTQSLDIPLYAGVRSDKLKLGVGPLLSFVVAENQIFDDVTFFAEQRQILEMGFGFHAGVVLHKFQLELGYQYRFNDIGDYLLWRGLRTHFDQSVQYVDLSLGLYF